MYKYYVKTNSRGYITELSDEYYEGYEEIKMPDKITEEYFNGYYKVVNKTLVIDELERENYINYQIKKAIDEFTESLLEMGML